MDFDADLESRSPWMARVVTTLVVAALLAAAAFGVRRFLGTPEAHRSGPTQIALIKQPPPPPPKPPEKPPEPPKVKEEVKLPDPKPEPKPDEPKPADEKPASDKPLGVDAAGAAGGDQFGLVGGKGGRDLLATGGGNGAYYSGLMQRQFQEALSRNKKMRQEQFCVVVRTWLTDGGRAEKTDIVTGSGRPQVDQMIQTTFAELAPLKDVPPSSMRQMELRVCNRS